jgi:hypothetical protein
VACNLISLHGGSVDPPASTEEKDMARTRIPMLGWQATPAKIAAACVLAATLGGWATPGQAGSAAADEDISIAKLEKMFWACDHAASHSFVDVGTGAACASYTDRLKQRKFNGDFGALLAWWQANKAAEHLALDAAGRNATAQIAPTSAR